jgi:hypothetical protein
MITLDIAAFERSGAQDGGLTAISEYRSLQECRYPKRYGTLPLPKIVEKSSLSRSPYDHVCRVC